ncbi:IstB ATP binding domain-containing protein [Roseibium sp. TrichSKD4]|uniref:AAA family ATPase n=1 Tax=Roseibium sp. TrichSKD4 TaxID=744980 RepID=UPI0001E567C5|nr:AAA family ATPase [Roseibium sp. TrichSKD4]EFO30496.1 IstB ATP binding domain-containing protein [Roseibium sp. TrichSKD4]
MKRIMITGGPGSGKSTLARMLGDKTGLPVFHMDKIHWQDGWVERTREEKDRLTHEVHMKDVWIFEGGHSPTYPERVARADTFIWLDVPVVVRLWRVLWRSIKHYGKTRPDLPEGCPERFNRQTIEFILFILRTRKSSREKLGTIHDNPSPHLSVYRLTSRSQVDAFVQGISTPRDGDSSIKY